MPNHPSYRKWLWIVLTFGIIVLLFQGWRLFYFLTDDAFISFRYIDNHMHGFGYVWNRAPFRPVEGYTNFLWMVVLEGIWRGFGIEPPRSCNVVSLAFSVVTLATTFLIVLKMQLGKALGAFRIELALLALLFCVTNRTFLAWTSSGLESALFNALFIVWVYSTLYLASRYFFGGTLVTASAALLCLTRPDGILFVLASLLFALAALAQEVHRTQGFAGRLLLPFGPLLLVVWHMTFRRFFYGEWVPNTFFAKSAAIWPESGLRYLASFAMEYGIPLLVVLALVAIWRSRVAFRTCLNKEWTWPALSKEWRLAIVLLVAGAHVGYYTLVVGGDHFEFRVYSHLIPFLFIGLIFLLDKIRLSAGKAAMCILLFAWAANVLPWTHFILTRNLNSRTETFKLRVPLASYFYGPMQTYVSWYDHLQYWLIEHSVGMRHQEHKVFYEFMSSILPQRDPELGRKSLAGGEYSMIAYPCVGLMGWRFPELMVLDTLGLNDYVIARGAVPENKDYLQMAHSRSAPAGYIDCFSLNALLAYDHGKPVIKIDRRKKPLTSARIIECEDRFIALAKTKADRHAKQHSGPPAR